MLEVKGLSMTMAVVTIALLLCSALLAPTFSAYADQGKGKSLKGDDNDKGKSGAGNNDGDHKKGKKDSDNDGDKNNNGKHEGCEEGKHLGNDKYKKECDSDHDFKK